MIKADITGDLKAFIAKVDAAGIPNQLYGYLSKLAGPGAMMVLFLVLPCRPDRCSILPAPRGWPSILRKPPIYR